MESLSAELIITSTLYSFFGFYLKKWSLDFRDQSFLFETFLTWFMGLASTFGVGFLIYFGYKFGWLLALKLLGISFIISWLMIMIEGALSARISYFFYQKIGMVAFVATPILGYRLLVLAGII
jgi:hypothetical protein|tara:strand:- start:32 stop:400 length:369 start_codon:yes stop_codon:yes gene_type:complete